MTGPFDPSPSPSGPAPIPPPTEHVDTTRGTRVPENAEADSELARLLDAYLADLEAGRCPDRVRLVANHPHLAPSLDAALAGLDFIHRAAPASPQAPAMLGDFRIVREIGRGGMGVVYEAEQVSLKRRVALKVLRFGPVIDTIAMQRFQREAETVGGLHHTNIVPIFAIGADEGVRYYAMQFIEGRDLGRVARELRGSRDPVDFRKIADWGLQAADALAHAHQRGVIHRDIKPSNLILDDDNRIWLTDFGLARRVDDVSLSLTGSLLGTPRYMSPEQAAAAKTPVDHRTDLYSLGATLYELVTGRPIFDAASPHEVISQILNSEPPRPRSVDPAIPRDLETILLHCLAKEPDRRYATARALTEDLRAFVEGRPIAARRPRLVERTTRWIRRHRRLTVTAGVSAVASVIVAWAGWTAIESYVAARRGRIQLSTTTPGALAEILDSEGRTVIPLFPVPNEKPVTLPSGSYRVRLSAPETLSETWPLDVAPRAHIAHSLPFSSRSLWPPQEFGPAPAFEAVPWGTGTSILRLLPPETAPDQPHRPARLRLVDGKTARPVWPEDLSFDASTLPGGELAEWQALLVHWAVAPNFGGTRIGERVTDLDRDGAGDFVLISRSSASLLAISGASGRVLWWHRSRPPMPADAPKDGRWTRVPGDSFVVGYPDIADLDGDGIDDVITCFHAAGSERFVDTDGRAILPKERSWMSAVSGRSGLELWKHAVPGDWSSYVSSSSGARFDRLAHPTVVRRGDARVVALVEGDRIRLRDGRTGEPAGGSSPLGFEIDRAPQFFEAGQPAKPHALVFRRYVDVDAHLEAVAVDVETGSIRWRDTALTVLGGVALELDAMPAESFRTLDLENDGASEVAFLSARHPRPNHWNFGLRVVEAATGTPRWETALYEGDHPQSIPSEARFLPVPDLDHDGSRDFVVALPFYDTTEKRHGILVAGVSGKNGVVLWRRHHPAAGGIRSLDAWQPGSDGWPLIVATTTVFQGGRDTTLVFESGSGRLAHTLLDVRDVRIADFDGDGAADLLHPARTQNTLRWVAIRGQPLPAWRMPGTWTAGPDADGDGRSEFYAIGGSTLTARSSGGGRMLWTRTDTFAMPETLWMPSEEAAPSAKAPSFVVAAIQLPRADGSPGLSTYRSIAAYSTRDGRRLWTSPDTDLGGGERGGSTLGWSYQYPRADFADLDGDGTPEVLVALPTEGGELRLRVVSGTDGRTLWHAPIVDGAMAPDPRPAGAPIADFDRDGRRDLALVVPPSAKPTRPEEAWARVDVRRGSDGRSLWPSAFRLSKDARHLVWPEPALGDLDGDGVPEVLVVRHSGYSENRGYACELVVLDGRSGLVRWTWSWDAGFPAIWEPIVLKSPETNRRRVVMGLTVLKPKPGIVTLGGFGFVILDAAGGLVRHQEVRDPGPTADRGGLAWASADLDGDGTDELLYPDGGFLCAGFGPDVRPRWRKPLGNAAGETVRVHVGTASLEGSGAALLLWTGRDVFGIEGSRGDVVWRGRAPGAPVWGTGGFPHLRIVSGFKAASLPGLAFAEPIARSEVGLLESTWPTTPDGRYRPTTARPGSVSGAAKDAP